MLNMQRRLTSAAVLLIISSLAIATNSPQTNTNLAASNPIAVDAARNTPPTLRQPGSNTNPASTALSQLQVQHQQQLSLQQKRLTQLEQANQEALAQNQTLQLKNDSLSVQVKVLQSERSAQMFLYGAATLGAGSVLGIIIYHLIYARRRRHW